MKRGVKQVGESCYDCLSLNGCGKSNADSGTCKVIIILPSFGARFPDFFHNQRTR